MRAEMAPIRTGTNWRKLAFFAVTALFTFAVFRYVEIQHRFTEKVEAADGRQNLTSSPSQSLRNTMNRDKQTHNLTSFPRTCTECPPPITCPPNEHLKPSQQIHNTAIDDARKLQGKLDRCNQDLSTYHSLKNDQKKEHVWRVKQLLAKLDECKSELMAASTNSPAPSEAKSGMASQVATAGSAAMSCYVLAMNESVRNACIPFHGTDRSKGTLHMAMPGRMGNSMIQFMYARAIADINGWGMHFSEVSRPENPTEYINHFPNAMYSEVHGAPVQKQEDYACGDRFLQNYLFFQGFRALAKCLYAPPVGILTNAMLSLKDNDVVIHYRIEDFFPEKSAPPPGYFRRILDARRSEGTLGEVWIITSADLEAVDMVEMLKREYGAKVQGGTNEQDHYLGRVAPTFIGSFGTYTWTIAYLSTGLRIHLPYFSSVREGTTWLPWHALFIHDDPRVMYSDCENGGGAPLTAQQVMGASHEFARGVAGRPKGQCKPRKILGKK